MNLSPVDPGASFVSPCEIWDTPYPSLCGSAPLTPPSLPSSSHPAERVGEREEDEEVEGERKEGALPLLEPRGGTGEPGTSLQYQSCRVSLTTKDITTR